MSDQINAFFAYPSNPVSISETIKPAIEEINQSGLCKIQSWEDCKTGGKIIIDVICRTIDQSSLFCVDLTCSNPNVLFELGYAIARGKRIWIILDPSIEDSKKLYDQIKILTTVGYSSYCNSRNIIDEFYKEQPWADLNETILSMSVQPSLSSEEPQTLLYLKNQHETEAAIRLSRIISGYKIPTTISDPRESTVQSLVWYAKKIWTSPGIISHLSSPIRQGALLHNSRYSFVSGLAYGFEKDLLMLAESNYNTPIDYRDILRHYQSPSECEKIVGPWLAQVSNKYADEEKRRKEYVRSVELALELRNISVGEYIAENEEQRLLDYFVETSSFLESLDGSQTVIVGRKGSGKTANLFAIAERLRKDKRNLICVIKPVSYEVQGIVRLIRDLLEKDEKGYLSEALWKFLLYTEIACNAENEIKLKNIIPQTGSIEEQLITLLDQNNGELKEDFAIRLERCVNSVSSIKSKMAVQEFRGAISELLHQSILHDLRSLLGKLLKKRRRVVILIDNLDKTWDRRNDIEHLSEFLLGLIRAARDMKKDFEKKDHWRDPINITIVIFLRSDIFASIMRNAREPDKIQYGRLNWDDKETLFRIIDERLISNQQGQTSEEIWNKMFCSEISDINTRQYILDHILPRPRDIVFFIKAALSTAINRGHNRVLQDDILEAEKQYSQFALESIQVENDITIPDLQNILYEFVGCKDTITHPELLKILSNAKIENENYDFALHHLITLSFLGLKVKDKEFRFCSNEEDVPKIEILAKRYAQLKGKEITYKIHNAFQSYLEIESDYECQDKLN